MVRFDDAVNHAEPQAHPLALLFSGEKGLEEFGLVFTPPPAGSGPVSISRVPPPLFSIASAALEIIFMNTCWS